MMEYIVAILKVTFVKEREDFNGIMDKYMRVVGEMERRMDLDCGKAIMEIAMRVSGSMAGKMVLELISIELVPIRDSLRIVLNMEMESSFLPMEIIIKAYMKKENLMELEDMIGAMAATMRVILLMVIAMVKANFTRKTEFITKVKALIS